MDSDGKFWFGIWSLITLFCLALMFSIVYTMEGKRDAMRDMVSKGADPMKVACALSMHEDKTMCVIDGVKGEVK